MDSAVEVGKVYEFNHVRKGVFRARVLEAAGDWATVEVVAGTAKMVSAHNRVLAAGERVTVRLSFLSGCHEVQMARAALAKWKAGRR